MTTEEAIRALDTLTEVWDFVATSINELAKGLTQLFEQIWGVETPSLRSNGLPRSPKHPYTFPVRKRRVRANISCHYRVDLKPPRNLPYQRRNY